MRYFAALLSTVTLSLSGCGGSADQFTSSTGLSQPTASAQNFSGKVQGTEFFIGATRNSSSFLAYLCDNLRARRFEGTLQSDAASLADFTINFDSTGAHGTVNINGAPMNFDAGPASYPAGLYWANATISGQPYFGGWILDGGQERGLVSLTGTPLSLTNPAPPAPTGVTSTLLSLRRPVVAPPLSAGGAPVTQISDGTSNISDGTSNISDGTSNITDGTSNTRH